ncbi:sugar phosphate nucleotidyltransferase [Paenibacillus sp. 1P07SE]|uniref:nucleotidyltransferase family protein n=1 Tax=Paenibacillus sp. 1P07SE TaxID=3132209 RepID=UPI0039A60705
MMHHNPAGQHFPVVLMAGGLGTRLLPLTEACPKPLLTIGRKPILEILLEALIRQSFREFYIAVNYKREMIESFCGDGSRFGIRIRYLRETRQLGTAGALGLLPKKLERPILVINADLLTDLDCRMMIRHHLNSGGAATMGVREHLLTVPYGVVEANGSQFEGLVEKPVQRLLVNAGIYVLEPWAAQRIPPDIPLGMPALFELLKRQGERLTVFPIAGEWLDIGTPESYARANREYGEVYT